MSIIYEALQKVERSKEGGVHLESKTIDQVIAARKPKPKNNKTLFFMFLALLIIVVVFVVPKYSFNSSMRMIPASPVAADKYKQAERNFIQDKQLSITEPKTQKEGVFPAGVYLLQGIVYDKEVPQAVINGKNLRVSDMIDDLQVKEITPSTVKLINSKDNTELALSF
ncbi:MAG: hypothetical protein WC412_01415 [Candidatus Omnitrophota bacterium]